MSIDDVRDVLPLPIMHHHLEQAQRALIDLQKPYSSLQGEKNTVIST